VARTGFPDIRSAFLSSELPMNQLAANKSLVDEIFRTGDSDYMVSLARGLHVIQVFCEDGRARLTIADVTRLSGLSRTVVSRCLYTLQELGFVGREGRYFFLLPKVLKLGYGYVSTASLPTLAQPILDRLTDATDSASAVVVLDGPDVLYIAKASPPSYRNIVSMTVNIGHRRPTYVTASGLVLLADLNRPDLEAYFGSLDAEEVRRMTNRDIADIEADVAAARINGYALTKLIFSASMRALSVPVCNVVGNVAAAMVLAVYDENSTDQEIVARHLPRLRKAARSLSEDLVE
jgi:IclR family pca regulon transcriptional regulator